MKKIALISLAALMLAACSKEEGDGVMRPEMRLTNTVEAETDIEAMPAESGVQPSRIAENETVWAWVANFAATSNEEFPVYNAERLTAAADGSLLGTKTMLFPREGGSVNIRAMHGPFTFDNNAEFPTEVAFTVEGDQSTGEDAYIKSDLLYAAAYSATTHGNPTTVPLTFYHMLSKLEIEYEGSTEMSAGISGITIDGVVLDGKFKPGTGADLTQQSERAAMIEAGKKTGALSVGTSSKKAIVVPQSMAGKTLTITFSGETVFTVTLPEDCNFESGRRTLVKVTLRGSELDVTASVEPWETEEEKTGSASNTLPAMVGDWFYSDGTWSTVRDLDKDAIGIVFQTDFYRLGEAEKEALEVLGVKNPQGLVMALDNCGLAAWSAEETVTDFEGLADCGSMEDLYVDISGLHNYNAVIAYAQENGGLEKFPAFKAVHDYGTEVPAPARTTGWFLPSFGQIYDFFAKLGGVKDLSTAKNDKEGKPQHWHYWYDNFASLQFGDYVEINLREKGFPEEFCDMGITFWTSSEFVQMPDTQESAWYMGLEVIETIKPGFPPTSSDYIAFCADDKKAERYVCPVLAF